MSCACGGTALGTAVCDALTVMGNGMIKPSLLPPCQLISSSVFIKVPLPMRVFLAARDLCLQISGARECWLSLSSLADPGGCPTVLEEQDYKTWAAAFMLLAQGKLGGRYRLAHPSVSPQYLPRVRGPTGVKRERNSITQCPLRWTFSFPSCFWPGCGLVKKGHSPCPLTSLLILFCVRVVSGNGHLLVSLLFHTVDFASCVH